MEANAVEFPGANRDIVRAQLFLPSGCDEPRGGVVVVHDVNDRGEASDGDAKGVARSLAEAGLACLLPDLWSRTDRPDEQQEPTTRWSLEESLPDRRALDDLDCAVGFLVGRGDVLSDGVGALGLGSGGTLAFLLGCTSRQVALAVAVGGRALYPELSANKPTQPLELLLNLDRPLLALCGAEDPHLPVADRELWMQKLDAAGKDHELVVYPGGAPNGAAVTSGEPFQRILRFLQERL